MKAVVYQKPYEITLKDVPDPEIKDPREMIVRITSTCICGSDLHLFHGLYPHMPGGTVLGHEFMGIVEEVGKDVKKWHKGDRVLVPFPISCGECEMCRAKLWTHCIRSNDKGEIGAAFGHGESYGGFAGGQAEYVRVPYADVSPIRIPDDLTDEQAIFLTDILPTAYWITDVCEVKPGDTVAVFGCGPVGLLAQRCAAFKGAERVIAVDQIPYRLEYAKRINPGVETIDFREVDPGEMIQEMTKGRGADVVIDAVGLEAEPTNPFVSTTVYMKRAGIPPLPGLRPEDQPPVSSVSAINWEIEAIRHGGTLGLAGAYGAKANSFPIGDIFSKGITIKGGQALVQNYLDELLKYIQEGKLRADDIITHTLSLEEAMEGYRKFGRREDNCIKVVMKPFH
ncbi:MAG: zinc-dependent alcohol dehydrogenase [Bacillota bacterium]|nr:zinc-dependent alcohol dehydrogenase [Bacillota bacterium]